MPVTPVAAQREKISQILEAWEGQAAREGRAEDHRIAALERVRPLAGVDEAVAAITERHGRRPRVVVTSADRSSAGAPMIDFGDLRAECLASEAPLALVFGTGFGLARELVESADARLAPISGIPEYNHLSVRSAAAVVLDRLFGLR